MGQSLHRAARDLVPFLLMPAAPRRPAPLGSLGDRLGHHVHDAVPVIRLAQLQDHLGVADPHEVAVALDEPGDRQPAFELDHFRVRAGGRFDLRGGAHRGDPAVPHRHRFRFGMVGIHRHHPAAEQHQVGGAADIGRLRAAAECQGYGDQKARRETRRMGFLRRTGKGSEAALLR